MMFQLRPQLDRRDRLAEAIRRIKAENGSLSPGAPGAAALREDMSLKEQGQSWDDFLQEIRDAEAGSIDAAMSMTDARREEIISEVLGLEPARTGAAFSLDDKPAHESRSQQLVSELLRSSGHAPRDKSDLFKELPPADRAELAGLLERVSKIRDRQKGNSSKAFVAMLKSYVEGEERTR